MHWMIILYTLTGISLGPATARQFDSFALCENIRKEVDQAAALEYAAQHHSGPFPLRSACEPKEGKSV